jgi:3-oxoacyl-[acyl-carrier protein] reductase
MLKGKTAIVTGASRGIGRAIATSFAEHGCNVAFTYHSSAEKAKALEEELSGKEVTVKGYRSDASDYAAAEQLIKDVLENFGNLDIVVNNAGITRDNLLMRMSEDQWEEVMRTNLKSVFNLSKFAIRPMVKQRGGSIINIGSVVGVQGNAGQANYAASKAGVIGFTKSFAKELGSRNIRANVVTPGFIETEMTAELDEKTLQGWKQMIPLRRAGDADEVAKTCVFLGSDYSSYITGQVISVCGGML